jgi:hypothetical protein
MGQGSLYPKGRNPLNNKARIKQKVPFILGLLLREDFFL